MSRKNLWRPLRRLYPLIDPEAYLRHILSVLPEWPSNRVDELLPWNVVLTNK
ncbi:transposase domain-containing protein [Escherichia coli]|nr:transposase domain-containing protein [Escherichia coli]